jgi:hypothetical protein
MCLKRACSQYHNDVFLSRPFKLLSSVPLYSLSTSSILLVYLQSIRDVVEMYKRNLTLDAIVFVRISADVLEKKVKEVKNNNKICNVKLFGCYYSFLYLRSTYGHAY